MFTVNVPKVSSSLAKEIEEAVLLGGANEIGNILALVKDDETFPDTVRYALEAIFYFRRYYGAGGELEPHKSADKKKALEMEALWGRELIDSLDYYTDITETKYA